MLVEAAETKTAEIELRQQAYYWRALHARATGREEAWKEKGQKLEQVVRRQQARIAKLTGELETTKARIAWLDKQVFGRKSEQCPEPDPCSDDPTRALDDDAADTPEPCGEPRRKRGKQPGAKGYTRILERSRSANHWKMDETCWLVFEEVICFTIFQTLLENGIDPKKWFTAYFEACAENGGRPPENLDEFMPWNPSQQQKDTWRCPEPFR